MNSDRRDTEPYGARDIIAVVCIIAFAGMIRIPSLAQPMGPDQGIMSVIGEGILHGRLPYRDFWEMGSPPIFFMYALIFKLFGTSMSAIPIADTIVSMLTTFLIFIVADSIWGRKVGYVSALLFAFFSNGIRFGMHAGGDIAFGTFWYIAQRETFMLPLMTASIYFLLQSERKERGSWKLVVSGLLAGLTFAFKFPALLFFLCLMLYVNARFFYKRGSGQKRIAIKYNAALISGFAFALVPFVVFFAFKGVLPEMLDVIFGFVSSVYGQIDHDYLGVIKTGITRTFFIAQENFILWVFFLVSSVHIIKNDRTKENLLIVMWSVASVLFVISHREFFGYHYLIILPSFSLLTGYGLVTALGPAFNLRSMFTAEFGKAFIVLAVVANLMFFTTLNFMHYTKAFYYLTGKITKEEYYAFFNAYPEHDYSFPADYQVAKYIKKNTGRDDMIYALGGIESVVYFLSKRKSPSRFIFSWIILHGVHGRVKRSEGYRNELLKDLVKKTPKYILTVKSLEQYRQFRDIYDFIEHNYTLEKVFQDDRYLYAYSG